MPSNTSIALKVLFVGAEAHPLAKVGGLGDVAGSLPLALKSLCSSNDSSIDIDIRLVIPFHSQISEKYPHPDLIAKFNVSSEAGLIAGKAYQIDLNGIPVYLIDGEPIHITSSVYSTDNQLDGIKYGFFSQAVLELMKELNWQPDIYHANDWHTAPMVYALQQLRKKDPRFKNSRSLITIHNLPFMGVGAENALSEYLLPPSKEINLPKWARTLPLPVGMASADHINTVSEAYAQEILTPEFGCGLENFLLSCKSNVSGILNGLDTDSWDPSVDSQIAASFDINHLDLRRKNKEALLTEFGFNSKSELPLLILISRMDIQKGVDIALSTLRQISDSPWQAILLGTGNSEIENSCLELEADFPDKVKVAMRFDSLLARRMYAGGDMLLMPSRYEPCGLAQMIAMRYGCVPVARATGGLKDTIQDESDLQTNTGFLFKEPTSDAFAVSLLKAIQTYQNPDLWQAYQINGMKKNFSWEQSAREYVKLYQILMELQP